MSDTSRLGLPRIDAAQSQKHVTHNEALDRLDVLLHLSVGARNLVTPPANPSEGWQGLVGTAPTGAFAGHALQVASWNDSEWEFYMPRKGWRAYVESDAALFVFDGTDWVRLRVEITEAQNLRLLGVGTAADSQNPVSFKANALLFAPVPMGQGGTGDVRIALNREQGSNTVSQLYQSNWSGRVETGLMGDDKYRIKVSADGAAWKEALVVDPATGRVNFPNGFADLRAPDPKAQVVTKSNSVLFAPFNAAEGGTGDVRIALNREQGSNTVSQLYQSNWSGRVETGLMGDDKYRIKVSADGAAWKEALVVDPATGRVNFPNGFADLTLATATTGLNLLEDGGRFAGNPEPVTGAVATFADASWLTSVNGATRVNYGVARPGATLNVTIADLLNKLRPTSAQASATEFFVLQVTAGTGVISPVSVQSVNYYPALSSSRNVGRGVTAGLYFRVISGALVMAPTDNITRLLIDGVPYDLWTDSAARVFTAAQGWKQMQMWQAPLGGSVSAFWPMRVTPGSVVLIATPFVASGLQTFATDVGPMPSQRLWR